MSLPRSIAGMVSRDHGAAFEQVLRDYFFTPLILHGALLRVDKLVAPVVPVGMRGKQPLWRQAARSGADWIGLLPGGRYLCAEAKSTAEDRLPRRAIQPKQEDHLNEVVAAGGVALLLVEFRHAGGPLWAAIPWQQVPWTVARTAQSLTLADAAAWQVRRWEDLREVLVQQQRSTEG